MEVIDSLIEACEESHIQYYTGICASIASFYHGQGRALPYEKEYDEASQLEKYQKLNLVNLEMEAETTYTTVSYTHLDVYKRQRQDDLHRSAQALHYTGGRCDLSHERWKDH